MKQNEGFGVCFNTQVAVDAGSHMIAGFKVTNKGQSFFLCGQGPKPLPSVI